MPEETKHMPSQDVDDSKRSGDRRLSSCSPSSDTPETDEYEANLMGCCQPQTDGTASVRIKATIQTKSRPLKKPKTTCLCQLAFLSHSNETLPRPRRSGSSAPRHLEESVDA